MADTMTLLPPNATAQERAVEQAMLLAGQVHAGVDGILSFKEAPPEAVLPWLVWEYGLEELLPFLPTARDVIEQGRPWERIKGTPEAVRLALSWLNYGAPSIEEETPAGAHWFEFMVDPGGVPDRYEYLQDVADLARLSAPVGTILSRIFHGYDVRRFMLDGSQFGDLLSDYSGVRDQDMGLVLSFGRSTPSAAFLDDGAAATDITLARTHFTNHKYQDRLIWDFGRFGDVPIKNHPIMHAHLFQIDGQGVQLLQIAADDLVLPKAAVVLSDGFVLGDTNAPLFAFEYHELGAPAPLSEGLALSGEPWRIEKRPVDERFERPGASFAAYRATPEIVSSAEARHTSWALNGRTWGPFPWLAEPWDTLSAFVRTTTDGNPA